MLTLKSPRMLRRAGSISLTTGKSWSSVRSSLTNSTMTLKAPWTESVEPELRRPIKSPRRVG